MKLHKLTAALAFGFCILSTLGYAQADRRSLDPALQSPGAASGAR